MTNYNEDKCKFSEDFVEPLSEIFAIRELIRKDNYIQLSFMTGPSLTEDKSLQVIVEACQIYVVELDSEGLSVSSIFNDIEPIRMELGYRVSGMYTLTIADSPVNKDKAYTLCVGGKYIVKWVTDDGNDEYYNTRSKELMGIITHTAIATFTYDGRPRLDYSPTRHAPAAVILSPPVKPELSFYSKLVAKVTKLFSPILP